MCAKLSPKLFEEVCPHLELLEHRGDVQPLQSVLRDELSGRVFAHHRRLLVLHRKPSLADAVQEQPQLVFRPRAMRCPAGQEILQDGVRNA